jgi:thermitase
MNFHRLLILVLPRLFLALFLAQSPSQAEAEQLANSNFVPGEFVIQSKPKKQKNLTSLFKSKKIKYKKINDSSYFVKIANPNELPQEKLIAKLKSLSGVDRVEPNFTYHITKSANDPFYPKLWALKNFGQADSAGVIGIVGVDINVENAWNLTTGSKKIIVAVIDTGVDFTIPDLKDNAWTNLAEANGLPQVDDDKNGYVDDIHGYNFVAENGNSNDDNGHGSHCSGTIGAKANDGYGVAGVNWETSIMAVKFISHDGSGTLENAIKAIDYARINGAKIMSNSWGGGGESLILKAAIEEAERAGILFVAAAGNDGADNDKKAFFPANYPVDNIISVASVNNRAHLSNFSNFGFTTTHIAAPGENILSTTPNGFETFSGTSMATPHVAGVAALLLALEPQLKLQEVRARILNNARPLFRLKNKIASRGMLDAFAVLSNIKPPEDETDPTRLAHREFVQISSLHPYSNGANDILKISRPGAKRIAFHFSRFETETNFDFLEILNGGAKIFDRLSGFHNDELSEIIEGDTILLHFTSDKSVNKYGFDIDQIFYE